MVNRNDIRPPVPGPWSPAPGPRPPAPAPWSTSLALALLLASAAARADVTPSWMVKLSVGGQAIEGGPLAWSTAEVHLLGRDGRLWTFDPTAASDFQQTARRFQSYSISQFRALLLRELGSGYEVTGTSHYLVVHPSGQGDQWADRFEELYRAFVHYFSVRGLHPSEPVFPLVGIVLANQREFLRYAARQGEAAGGGVLGFYSPQSNRIALYDQPTAAAAGGRWQSTAGVIIHEATHQTAFNTGVHSRYAPPPHWLAEGLAMMFEAPGVYDSLNHPQLGDRVHRDRLRQFRLLAPQHRPELLRELVASDRLFRRQPGGGLRGVVGAELLPGGDESAEIHAVPGQDGRPGGIYALFGGRAGGRLHGSLRRRLADAGGADVAFRGGARKIIGACREWHANCIMPTAAFLSEGIWKWTAGLEQRRGNSPGPARKRQMAPSRLR